MELTMRDIVNIMNNCFYGFQKVIEGSNTMQAFVGGQPVFMRCFDILEANGFDVSTARETVAETARLIMVDPTKSYDLRMSGAYDALKDLLSKLQ
jgi:hypothetical protein